MPAANLTVLAAAAVDLVTDGMVVGLGSGRASRAFIEALGRRAETGAIRIRGVATSQSSADLATQFGIELLTLDEVDSIDITIDGADEVDPQRNCIKGYGGALVREKVVAAASKKLVILVGAEKLVDQLGQRGKLPVEVVPFALGYCQRELSSLELVPNLRQEQGRPFSTDNGNLILDCGTGLIANAEQLEQQLRAIPGVVGTGLFLGMANQVLVERDGRVETL